jgi:tetrathionate reductase subunit B
MTRYAWLIDTTRCIGCNTCTVVCKDQFVDNDWPPYTLAQPDAVIDNTGWQVKPGHLWMSVTEMIWGKAADYSTKVRWIPKPCMLCDKPPCVTAATGGAGTLRPDGVVIFDPVKSKGQKQIVDACPYGKIFWNDALQIPQKCNLCLHRLEKGLQPACVNACPTQVLTVGDGAALAASVTAKNAKVLNPEFNTDSKAYYAGLP